MKRRIRFKKNSGCGIYVLLVVIFTAAMLVFLRSDFFSIKSIEVEGNSYVSEETILACSDIKIGQNIFDFKAKDIQNSLKSIARIKNVSIVRAYPDTVKIIITERNPMMYIYNEGKYYTLDDEGIVFEADCTNIASGAIMVSGFSDITIPEVGKAFDFSLTAQTQTVYEVIDFFKRNNLIEYVSEIYISQSGYYYIYTTKSNVIKFYSLASFQSNEDMIKYFLTNEEGNIMLEVIEDSNPVYKIIDIN